MAGRSPTSGYTDSATAGPSTGAEPAAALGLSAEALLLADRVLVMDGGSIVADENPQALLHGAGGTIAQDLVAVPRAQADRLAERAR